MIYFKLPSSYINIFQDIQIESHPNLPPVFISQSLCNYMNDIKSKISSREKEWDFYKKYTNPYEYIHTIVPQKNKQVSKYKPISRSYFKMLEMIEEFNLDFSNRKFVATFSDETMCRAFVSFSSTTNCALTESSNSYAHTLLRNSPKPSFWEPDKTPSSIGGTSHLPAKQYTMPSVVSLDKLSSHCSFSPGRSNVCDTRSCFVTGISTFPKQERNLPRICESVVRNGGLSRETMNESQHSTFHKPLCMGNFVNKMRTFHLAEGPGGFIEAICNKRNNPNDEYYGMTIILDENDDNVPAWHKTSHFLSQHPNITIEYGIDGTGNLLHIDNFEHCVNKYASSMDLITADGGFDFSKDFNRQEINITKLLWGQVCYALCLQKQGGDFVLKIFDVFYKHTVDILYILSSFYEDVNICKLKTSRVGNSEKYVVCKKFRFLSCSLFYSKIRESFLKIKSDFFEFEQFFNSREIDITGLQKREVTRLFEPRINALSYDNNPSTVCADTTTFSARPACSDETKRSTFGSFSSTTTCALTESFDSYALRFAITSLRNSPNADSNHIWRLLDCEIPRHFTKTIEEINAIFGQQQIENIHYTISLIDKQPKQDKLDQLVKQNVVKCINWCIEHSVAYNNLVTTNAFESSSSVNASNRTQTFLRNERSLM